MTSPLHFLREVQLELSKVVWPSRKQTIRLTVLVIGISIAVGLYIGALDIMFLNITNTILR